VVTTDKREIEETEVLVEWADKSASWNIQGPRYIALDHTAMVRFDQHFKGMDTHDSDNSIKLNIKAHQFPFLRLSPVDTGSEPIPLTQLTIPTPNGTVVDLTVSRDAKSTATTSSANDGYTPRTRWIHARTDSVNHLKKHTGPNVKSLLGLLFWGLTEPSDTRYAFFSVLICYLTHGI
jgi:hypothetical protein